MKNFIHIILTFCFWGVFLPDFGQEVLVVPEGIGTLNDAIDEYGGDRIYQLTAGKWYQLTEPIENDGYHLQIIGSAPTEEGGMPATLQTGTTAEGAVMGAMFSSKGDITIKNIYLMNVDLTGTVGKDFLLQSKLYARVIVDNCIIDPVCLSSGIVSHSSGTKVYFTNNLVIRMGHQLSPNDGFFFNNDNSSGAGLDTLYVENNTFVCMGTSMTTSGFTKFTNNYIKWNHNTFVMQKSQIDWSVYEKEYYWTNNLMFDFQTQPWNSTWGLPGADASKPLPALILADTLAGETLPSTRIQYVEYNMHYRNPKFYALLDELNQKADQDGKARLYFEPLVWPVDSIGVSRETELFNNEEAFPLWQYGNTLDNIDPQWEDQSIYTYSDNFVDWTKYATLIHAMSYPADNYPPASEWTQWHWDPDGDASVNDAWPVFNGKYTNTTLMKASIAGLPLGDLNWFPSAKEAWEENKELIDAHMKSGNEEKIDIGWYPTISKLIDNPIKMSAYPNPFSGSVTISCQIEKSENIEIIIYNSLGQPIKELVNEKRNAGQYSIQWDGVNDAGIKVQNGLYFYRVKAGYYSKTGKIMKTNVG